MHSLIHLVIHIQYRSPCYINVFAVIVINLFKYNIIKSFMHNSIIIANICICLLVFFFFIYVFIHPLINLVSQTFFRFFHFVFHSFINSLIHLSVKFFLYLIHLFIHSHMSTLSQWVMLKFNLAHVAPSHLCFLSLFLDFLSERVRALHEHSGVARAGVAGRFVR